MAKLNLSSIAKREMVNEFTNKVVGGSGYSQAIGLFRADITNSVDFNNMNQISLDGTYGNNNLAINGLQNFKALQLINQGGIVKLSSVHNVSVNDDIGNFENLGSLVWAIPGGRNVDWVVIGSHNTAAGYFRTHAAIALSPTISPSTDAKTFLISNLSIEFKGDGE